MNEILNEFIVFVFEEFENFFEMNCNVDYVGDEILKWEIFY